jgi:2-succinyl-5-enolpyruvyl-6-hydroxy-3-cyclohexene-1-carboxylate synthase
VTEPRLARDLVAALPGRALLLAASSMPIRDADQVMRPRRGVRIIGNRGASGIDGLVSTAVGAALAHSGPSYALLGDLAFLHDQNGLVLGPGEARPDLAIVVVNNAGGGIFSLLPQAGLTGPFERVFGTPHQVDLAYVAAAHGLPYTPLESMSELPKAIGGEGLRIVEARTDRAANAALHGRLREAAHAAVRAVTGG